jgi:hypothetical protein
MLRPILPDGIDLIARPMDPNALPAARPIERADVPIGTDLNTESAAVFPAAWNFAAIISDTDLRAT